MGNRQGLLPYRKTEIQKYVVHLVGVSHTEGDDACAPQDAHAQLFRNESVDDAAYGKHEVYLYRYGQVPHVQEGIFDGICGKVIILRAGQEAVYIAEQRVSARS